MPQTKEHRRNGCSTHKRVTGSQKFLKKPAENSFFHDHVDHVPRQADHKEYERCLMPRIAVDSVGAHINVEGAKFGGR